MITNELFSGLVYENETRLAQLELSAFVGGVTERFGPEQAKISVRDWLDESELMDSPPLSTIRDWRAVTVAALARLASRVNDALLPGRPPVSSPDDAKVSPIPSSNIGPSTVVI